MTEFLRRYATPLSLVTGLAIALTGIMMFFGVRGEMSELHEWLGWAFVVALLMHIVRNWRALLGMMKPARSKVLIGALTVAMAALIITHLPDGQGGAHRGGPWMALNRVADAPISASAPALGLSSDEVIARLKAKGITVTNPQQSLSEIAKQSEVELPRLFGVLLEG